MLVAFLGVVNAQTRYMLGAKGAVCVQGSQITTAAECINAGQALGKTWSFDKKPIDFIQGGCVATRHYNGFRFNSNLGGRADHQHAPICITRDCVMNAFTWGKCSKTCGGGRQTGSRTVKTHPFPGGRRCPSTVTTRACNTQPCAVDCELSKWTKWGSCSKKCGGGIQKRVRHIKTEAKHGGGCTGDLEEMKDCNTRECTQHEEVQDHVKVVESMIDAVTTSHSGMDEAVAQVSKHVKAVADVKEKAVADLTAIRDKLTIMKAKLADKKTKLGKEDATINAALSELKSKWSKLNSQQAEKLKSAEEKRSAHEKKIVTMLNNLKKRRRRLRMQMGMF